MEFKVLTFVLSITLISIEGRAVSKQLKRDAFDPNELMERYMNIRTDQDAFGSFHPNDLINTIKSFFENSKQEGQSNNQWGLFVYNPNDAIGQYMGTMNSPGTLGPDPDKGAEMGPDSTSNWKPGKEQGLQSGFDPSVLNQNIMNSLKQKVTASSDQHETADNLSFDPDSLNKMLMANVQKSPETSQFMGNSPHVNNWQSKPDGTAKDSENGTKTGYSAARWTTKSSVQNVKVGNVGFNPDALNANLYNTVKYDPNSVNSAMLKMAPMDGTSTISGAQNSVSFNSGIISQHIDTDKKADTNSDGKSSQNHVEGNRISHLTGTTTQASLMAVGNSGDTETHQTNKVAEQSGTIIGSNHFIDHNSLQSQTSGITGNVGTFNAGGLGPQSSGSQSSGTFLVGGMGSQSNVSQNQGLPSGIHASGDLAQIDQHQPTASGIGSMG